MTTCNHSYVKFLSTICIAVAFHGCGSNPSNSDQPEVEVKGTIDQAMVGKFRAQIRSGVGNIYMGNTDSLVLSSDGTFVYSFVHVFKDYSMPSGNYSLVWLYEGKYTMTDKNVVCFYDMVKSKLEEKGTSQRNEGELIEVTKQQIRTAPEKVHGKTEYAYQFSINESNKTEYVFKFLKCDEECLSMIDNSKEGDTKYFKID